MQNSFLSAIKNISLWTFQDFDFRQSIIGFKMPYQYLIVQTYSGGSTRSRAMLYNKIKVHSWAQSNVERRSIRTLRPHTMNHATSNLYLHSPHSFITLGLLAKIDAIITRHFAVALMQTIYSIRAHWKLY